MLHQPNQTKSFEGKTNLLHQVSIQEAWPANPVVFTKPTQLDPFFQARVYHYGATLRQDEVDTKRVSS